MNKKELQRIKKINEFFQWIVRIALTIGGISILGWILIWLYYQP